MTPIRFRRHLSPQPRSPSSPSCHLSFRHEHTLADNFPCVFPPLQDVRAYLAASEEQQFDLVVAAETLQYLGPLDTVVSDTFKVLNPGGYFAFTVDRRRGGEDGDGEEDEEGEERGSKEQVGESETGVFGDKWRRHRRMRARVIAIIIA